MKIFLDANVLVSVLNKEYPLFSYSSRILSLADNAKYKVHTSPLCMAIAFYFAEKKHGTDHARTKINLLAERLHFTSVDEETVQSVIRNKKIHDFEDGLQYYSVLESDCKYIVTEDKNDFYFSEIEVLGSRMFLEKYIF
ncbi:MAG: twitching motility protein PilT [Bacteroidetes bacterium]|nr:twitching motility protein PilT [Bacteroidota bacterium]